MGNPVWEGYATTDDTVELDINIDLDKLASNIDDLEKLAPAVERGVRFGIEELCVRLEEKMREYLIEYDLGDSTLMSDIRIIPYGDGISITVGQDYAVYVEYGTGLVGEQNPHPRPDGWEYAIGEHSSEGGWWYPTTESDPNPKKWYSKNGDKAGIYAWTNGQPSRPFMYNTWLWGTRSATQIIRKNIKAEIQKIQRRSLR